MLLLAVQTKASKASYVGTLKMVLECFTDHPTSVGETYGEHLRTASGFGVAMMFAGAACLIHGLLPFLFTNTGSATISRLHDRMTINRKRYKRNGDGSTEDYLKI